MSVPLTTGKTVAAFAWAATMQSAIRGASIEKVFPRRPVIRATVVWKPPALSSQIATPPPTAKPAGSSTVICCSPKSPSRASGETAPSALRRIVLPFRPRTVTPERRWSESRIRYSPSPISTTPPPRPAT